MIECEFSKPDQDFDKIKAIIAELEVCIKKLFENYEWAADSNFLAYQLPFKECLVDAPLDNKETLSIFLASSFILPINFEKIRNEIQQIKTDFVKYKTMLDIHTSISAEKEEIKKIKIQIDQTEKKYIEILSIFAAIVLFASGEIQLFKDVQNPELAGRFMFMWGYGLAVFVLLIWMITRDYQIKVSNIHWVLIVIFILATYIAIAGLFNFFPF